VRSPAEDFVLASVKPAPTDLLCYYAPLVKSIESIFLGTSYRTEF